MNDSELMKRIGLRLKIARRKNGLNQSQASDFLGINQGYLSQIETGKRTISLSYLRTILEFYKVSWHDFFKDFDK